MKTYLIAHVTRPGVGPAAQAMVEAENEAEARRDFRRAYPDRTIVAVGIKGEGR